MKEKRKEKKIPDTGNHSNNEAMQQNITELPKQNNLVNLDIPLQTQEIAFMIVNKVYATPELLEGLIKSVELWIIHNLTEDHITELLTNPAERINKELNDILLESLTSIISDLAEVNEKNNG